MQRNLIIILQRYPNFKMPYLSISKFLHSLVNLSLMPILLRVIKFKDLQYSVKVRKDNLIASINLFAIILHL